MYSFFVMYTVFFLWNVYCIVPLKCILYSSFVMYSSLVAGIDPRGGGGGVPTSQLGVKPELGVPWKVENELKMR